MMKMLKVPKNRKNFINFFFSGKNHESRKLPVHAINKKNKINISSDGLFFFSASLPSPPLSLPFSSTFSSSFSSSPPLPSSLPSLPPPSPFCPPFSSPFSSSSSEKGDPKEKATKNNDEPSDGFSDSPPSMVVERFSDDGDKKVYGKIQDTVGHVAEKSKEVKPPNAVEEEQSLEATGYDLSKRTNPAGGE